MNPSLREQLLKAGLVTEKQAKKVERSGSQERHRQAKGDGSPPPRPEPARASEQARAAKLLRDQELNRKQQEKAARRALAAQFRQLVEQLRVPRPASDDSFNFVDQGKVRSVPVTPPLRADLAAGRLLIVRCEGRYELVPAEAADRIRERDATALVALPAAAPPAEDDPYKDYAVPDDLTW